MAHSALPLVEQPTCVWTAGSRKFAIHLRPDVIGRLGIEAWMAFKKVPRRGLEIGGILLGRMDCSDSETTTFLVEGFKPVESEHRSGPSYLLSPAELAGLQEEIGNGSEAIGIFRSQTRSEQLTLADADREMFDRCLPHGNAVFLLLGPAPGLAGFFAPVDGALRCVHEFTLASSLSAIMTLRQGRGSSAGPRRPHIDRHAELHPDRADEFHNVLPIAAKQLEAPELLRRLDAPETNHTPQSEPAEVTAVESRPLAGMMSRVTITRGWWVAAAVIFLVLAATAGTLSDSLHRSSANRQATQFLHLSVQTTGSSLRILWDPNASAVRGAARAVLHIQDGEQQVDRDLAPAELSAGSIRYEPKSAEVTFRLDVYSVEPNATGFVEVMNVPAAAPASPARKPALPAHTDPFAGAVRTPAVEDKPFEQPQSRSTVDEKPFVAPQPLTAQAPPTAAIAKPMSTAPVAAASPASSQGTVSNAQAKIYSDPPGNVAAAPITTQPMSSMRASAPVKPAVLSQPPPQPIRVETEVVSGSRVGRMVGQVPVLRRLTKSNGSEPPIPVYEAQPAVKVPAASLERPVSVGVRVYVAASGAVDYAEVVDYGDPPNWSLVNASLTAARRWTFKPARLDDVAVPAQLILHFHYIP